MIVAVKILNISCYYFVLKHPHFTHLTLNGTCVASEEQRFIPATYSLAQVEGEEKFSLGINEVFLILISHTHPVLAKLVQ